MRQTVLDSLLLKMESSDDEPLPLYLNDNPNTIVALAQATEQLLSNQEQTSGNLAVRRTFQISPSNDVQCYMSLMYLQNSGARMVELLAQGVTAGLQRKTAEERLTLTKGCVMITLIMAVHVRTCNYS